MSNWKSRAGQKAVKAAMKRMRDGMDHSFLLYQVREALDANHAPRGRYDNRILQLMLKGWVLAPCKCGGWYRTTRHYKSGFSQGTGCCRVCRRAYIKTRAYRTKVNAFWVARNWIRRKLRRERRPIHQRCCVAKCQGMGRVRIFNPKDRENFFFCCDAHWKNGLRQLKAGRKPAWAKRRLADPLQPQGVETAGGRGLTQSPLTCMLEALLEAGL